ncbi:hypothetical protein F5Y16DRAFT_358614 [Xylariaceae sp. FL0255]|nr:hypothetical protein F5Y16DRAFT_358614 [Xylariaceae sp. FL0255]
MSHYEDGLSETEQQVVRPSRYLTVRKKQSIPTSPVLPTTRDSHGAPLANSNPVSRSMSRYRRSTNIRPTATTTTSSDPNNNTTPPVPSIPRTFKKTMSSPKDQEISTPRSNSPPLPQLHNTRTKHQVLIPLTTDRSDPATTAHDSNLERSVPMGRDTQSRSSEQSDEAARASQEKAQWEAQRDRLLAEQKKKDLQRLEEQLENSQRSIDQPQSSKDAMKGKISRLTKPQKSSKKEDMSPLSPAVAVPSPVTVVPSKPEVSKRAPEPEPTRKTATHIEPGGKGIVPLTDAPKTAINADDRNVTVRCRHHTLSLSISPDTTAADLLTQTSQHMPYDFVMRPDAWHVVEKYTGLGLERRLRHYEHIRDVMNTWDRDSQNQLAVTYSDPEENHDDLNMSSVPKTTEGPPGCQLWMYHSNKPGKWNRRWISVLETGQIISAKEPNLAAKAKDTVSLCRLSDYDIYTPSEAQMRRQLKPPKGFCFGVKSQQKTTIFLNTDNYVQYFCTEDLQAAREFSETVQGWRSWYLVDRRPENTKQTDLVAAITEMKETMAVSSNISPSKGHRMKISVNENFESLLDMTRFDKRASQYSAQPSNSHHRQSSSIHHRRMTSNDGFIDGGLLDTEYEDRKQALEEKRQSQHIGSEHIGNHGVDKLLGDSPSTPPKAEASATSWFPSALEHSVRMRDDGLIASVPRMKIASAATTTDPTAAATDKNPDHGVSSSQKAVAGSSTRRPTGPSSSSTATRPSTKHASSANRLHTHPNPHHHHPSPNPETENPFVVPRHPSQPKPLLDLSSSDNQEPPQWKRGRGVKPDGAGHLVNFISEADVALQTSSSKRPGTSSAPAKSAVPAVPSTTTMLTSRSRSKSYSASAAPAGNWRDATAPPVPGLPSSHHQQQQSRQASRNRSGSHHRYRDGQHRDRERERREYKEREAAYNAVPGRTGILKAV